MFLWGLLKVLYDLDPRPILVHSILVICTMHISVSVTRVPSSRY